MGNGQTSNLTKIFCLAIQKAHYQIQKQFNQCLLLMIPDILRISEKTETGLGSAEGCDVFLQAKYERYDGSKNERRHQKLHPCRRPQSNNSCMCRACDHLSRTGIDEVHATHLEWWRNFHSVEVSRPRGFEALLAKDGALAGVSNPVNRRAAPQRNEDSYEHAQQRRRISASQPA